MATKKAVKPEAKPKQPPVRGRTEETYKTYKIIYLDKPQDKLFFISFISDSDNNLIKAFGFETKEKVEEESRKFIDLLESFKPAATPEVKSA